MLTIHCKSFLFAEEKEEFIAREETSNTVNRSKARAGARICNLFAEKFFELMLQRDHYLSRIKAGEEIDLDKIVVAILRIDQSGNVVGPSVSGEPTKRKHDDGGSSSPIDLTPAKKDKQGIHDQFIDHYITVLWFISCYTSIQYFV